MDHRPRAFRHARLEWFHGVWHDVLAAAAPVPDAIVEQKLAEVHFWLGTVGILVYIVAIYTAGITQGLMWRAFDETGRLAYPDFVETVQKLLPMYWVRVVGGTMYFLKRADGLRQFLQDLAKSAGDL